MISRVVCGVTETIQESHERLVQESNQNQNRDSNPSQILQYNVVYISLYIADNEKVGKKHLQQQHRFLNQCFMGQNNSLQKVPSQWQSRIGFPNIQFLPLDHNEVRVIYVPVDSWFTSNNPAQEAWQRVGLKFNNAITIYLGRCFNQSANGKTHILGSVDQIGGSVIFVDFTSVGGPDMPLSEGYNHGYSNDDPDSSHLLVYDQGSTLVHEMGHIFSNTHTFMGLDTCQLSYCKGFSNGQIPQPIYPDVPTQYNPNYFAQLALVNGSYQMKNDNRSIWRSSGKINSTNGVCTCLTINPSNQQVEVFGNTQLTSLWPSDEFASLNIHSPVEDPNEPEMGCAFMDYASDTTRVMFTRSMTLRMRNHARSSASKLGFQNVTGQTFIAPNAQIPIDESVIGPPPSLNVGSNVTLPAITSDFMSGDQTILWIIIGCVVGGLILLSILGYWLYKRYKKKHIQKHHKQLHPNHTHHNNIHNTNHHYINQHHHIHSS
jgi:hypothetical protein